METEVEYEKPRDGSGKPSVGGEKQSPARTKPTDQRPKKPRAQFEEKRRKEKRPGYNGPSRSNKRTAYVEKSATQSIVEYQEHIKVLQEKLAEVQSSIPRVSGAGVQEQGDVPPKGPSSNDSGNTPPRTPSPDSKEKKSVVTIYDAFPLQGWNVELHGYCVDINLMMWIFFFFSIFLCTLMIVFEQNHLKYLILMSLLFVSVVRAIAMEWTVVESIELADQNKPCLVDILDDSSDYRWDAVSIGDLKHQPILRDIVYKRRRLIWGNYFASGWQTTQLAISFEMVMQVYSPVNVSLCKTLDMVWEKIDSNSKTVHSINIPRACILYKDSSVVQNSCIVAFKIAQQMWERYEYVNFPRPQQFQENLLRMDTEMANYNYRALKRSSKELSSAIRLNTLIMLLGFLCLGLFLLWFTGSRVPDQTSPIMTQKLLGSAKELLRTLLSLIANS